MDTDGSVYRYRHRVYGHQYKHIALCFKNHSVPLLHAVEQMLENASFRPRTTSRAVYLYRQEEARRYFRIIGTSNPKHQRRFDSYLI